MDRMSERAESKDEREKRYVRDQQFRALTRIHKECREEIDELKAGGLYGFSLHVTDEECGFIVYVERRTENFNDSLRTFAKKVAELAEHERLKRFGIRVRTEPNQFALDKGRQGP